MRPNPLEIISNLQSLLPFFDLNSRWLEDKRAANAVRMYSEGSVLVVQGCCERIRSERRDEKTTDRVGVVSIKPIVRVSVKATSRFALKPMSEFEESNGYQREVLGVRAPVAVLLAHKAVPLSLILDLVPGAMIQFSKNCDAPLVLEVGGHPLAVGEAVKVEDKFGLRVRTFNVTEEDL